jgi:hypothetical protein
MGTVGVLSRLNPTPLRHLVTKMVNINEACISDTLIPITESRALVLVCVQLH